MDEGRSFTTLGELGCYIPLQKIKSRRQEAKTKFPINPIRSKGHDVSPTHKFLDTQMKHLSLDYVSHACDSRLLFIHSSSSNNNSHCSSRTIQT
ncbi:hypothetical protein TNCT_649851 [Trichonephila clavata]|uniref:Uncharacterized protein n=1 Tax=Trichonephila clavata TaxID=2740835 RepID=A0A8X6H0X5_TRICU|nr:hypothetical protein TNCT_649851 [Trichonephila clavata]